MQVMHASQSKDHVWIQAIGVLEWMSEQASAADKPGWSLDEIDFVSSVSGGA